MARTKCCGLEQKSGSAKEYENCLGKHQKPQLLEGKNLGNGERDELGSGLHFVHRPSHIQRQLAFQDFKMHIGCLVHLKTN